MIRRLGDRRPGGREGLIADEPVGHLGKPEVIASVVLWLSFEGSASSAGAALVVDGGQDAWNSPPLPLPHQLRPVRNPSPSPRPGAPEQPAGQASPTGPEIPTI